ncbi:S8 family peptidase [Clostridium sp. UBA4548]|uniref:S8 family peptidase n=1 Tax=Clostridium sp. UBA4548 TaxID=1946361 RepID=UPI0025C0E892|nr:S8 family peptidase [Clostridium sp. UBA4548]
MEIKYYNNIFLDKTGEAHKYKSKNQGGRGNTLPPRNRIEHGERIQRKLQGIWERIERESNDTTAVALNTRGGTYLEFESTPNFNLTTKSLESTKDGIRLLNVRKEIRDEETFINKATVFIPKGKENHFLKKINAYLTKETGKGRPANENLIASINDIKLAVLESFWTGSKDWIPKDDLSWCEVWISSDSDEKEAEFRNVLELLGIESKREKISFPERRVLFVKANKDLLQKVIENTHLVAEIRRATETAAFFIDLENTEQTEWANELLNRLKVNQNSNTYISVLDTGVNNGHMLLKPILNDDKCYSYESTWGTYDHEGHGTSMAGLSAFGNLQSALECNHEITVDHCLESYKILPPRGENNPQLYGAITTDAVSNLIIDNPNKQRIICMAITAPKYQTGDGSPSSWSAAIDEITSGYIDGIQKLFLVSAGNIQDNDDWMNYPISNITRSVQNPGQSWNAVTVGAYTEKCTIDREKYGDMVTVASSGELSPYSSTSASWDSKWPIKPEIVLEGGNIIKDSHGCYGGEDDLSLLTTNYMPSKQQFTTIWATSAATAQASWMAAKLQSMYPNAWPETIRALLIHSAEWTDAMKKQFLDGNTKTDFRKLLRTCGYGVPNLQKAILCANNSVNLIIQSELQPFEKVKGSYKSKDMHIHELPWPSEILQQLYTTQVEMKVTLSYFIEPGPGEVGWKDRYRYASCALRFDVNGSDTKEVFMSRISKAIEEENNDIIKSGGGNVNWLLGPNSRNVGSIHSDVWKGTAAELATSNLIAIYPAIGWWRERSYLGRWDHKIRYSLIVSISTPKVETDLYTPIISKIEVNNKVKVEIPT